jgi:hypothetical protein
MVFIRLHEDGSVAFGTMRAAVCSAVFVDAGAIEVVLQDGSSKKIGITRAHVEEDAGEAIKWRCAVKSDAARHVQPAEEHLSAAKPAILRRCGACACSAMIVAYQNAVPLQPHFF